MRELSSSSRREDGWRNWRHKMPPEGMRKDRGTFIHPLTSFLPLLIILCRSQKMQIGDGAICPFRMNGRDPPPVVIPIPTERSSSGFLSTRMMMQIKGTTIKQKEERGGGGSMNWGRKKEEEYQPHSLFHEFGFSQPNLFNQRLMGWFEN